MKLRYKIALGFMVFLVVLLTGISITISYTSDCQPIEVATTNDTMQAVRYSCYGPPEVLQLLEVDKPVPKDNQLLIKVHAAGVNPLDWHYMRGAPYIMRLGAGLGAPDDQRMGVDFAGTVVETGKEVTKFKIGDEVFGGATGAFGEYVVASEDWGIALKPPNVSFEEAASVPIAAITALQALRNHGEIQAGQKVLINGASGGVGTFAVQIAKSLGAEVTGVCSTRNQEMVRSLGADHMFDYKKEDYTQSGNQYDLIVDMVSNHSVSKNIDVLKPDGTFVIVGADKGNWIAPLMNPLKAMIMANFVDQKLKFFVASLEQDDMNYLADLMEAGKLTAAIERTYSLEEVPAAIAHSEGGHARGKLVINLE
ncbi:MAG: NAD(P)-dependent alcohol dehydrogenase [Cyclobacteriaceae bacterium]